MMQSHNADQRHEPGSCCNWIGAGIGDVVQNNALIDSDVDSDHPSASGDLLFGPDLTADTAAGSGAGYAD